MNIYVYIAKLNRVKWYVHRSIGARRKEALWREMNKNIESGEESVCSRASYNYSTLVTIQCLLKVRDFVARFLRATSKMASSAGLFACWPVLHSRKDFLSLESKLNCLQGIQGDNFHFRSLISRRCLLLTNRNDEFLLHASHHILNLYIIWRE